MVLLHPPQDELMQNSQLVPLSSLQALRTGRIQGSLYQGNCPKATSETKLLTWSRAMVQERRPHTIGNGTPRVVISRYWRAAGLLSSLQDGWDELSQAWETGHLQQRVMGKSLEYQCPKPVPKEVSLGQRKLLNKAPSGKGGPSTRKTHIPSSISL